MAHLSWTSQPRAQGLAAVSAPPPEVKQLGMGWAPTRAGLGGSDGHHHKSFLSAQWMEWHPRAPVLLAGTADGNTWMWKVPNGDCKTFQGPTCPATCGHVLPDGESSCLCRLGWVRSWHPGCGSRLPLSFPPSLRPVPRFGSTADPGIPACVGWGQGRNQRLYFLPFPLAYCIWAPPLP